MSDVARLAVLVDANVASAVGKLKGVETQFWRTDAAARQMDANVAKSGKSVAKSTMFLNGATKGMAIGAGAALGLSAKAAVDWESAFTGVRKTMDGSEADFKAVEGGLRKMAMQIPVGATALAGIAETAAQLGIKKGNILDFTRVIADMGVATNLAGEEGASTMAKFANITGMSQGNFERLGSTIVALGNNGASTEADIAAMGLRIAAAGKQVGMSEPQTLAYANALSSVGVEAEAGGTAMSRVFKSISTDVRKGGKDLWNLARVSGMTSDQFKKSFEQDAAGATQKFLQGLGKMQKNGGDVLGILESLEFDDVRVSDSILRLAGNSTVLADSLKTGQSAWRSNTALATEAERRYATTASQIQILKNHATEAGISIGTAFLPSINTFAQFGVSVLHSQVALDGLAVAAGALGGRMVGIGIASLVGQLPMMISMLGEARAAMSLFAATGSLAAFTTGGAGIAAMLGPIGLVAGAGLAAAAAMGAFSGSNNGAAASAAAVTAALRSQNDAMLALQGASVGEAEAKLRIKSAATQVAVAENSYKTAVAQSGRGSLAARQAHDALAQAKLQQIRASLDLAGATNEANKKQGEAKAANERTLGVEGRRVAGLMQLRDWMKKQGATGQQLTGINRAIASSTRKLASDTAAASPDIQQLVRNMGKMPKTVSTILKVKDPGTRSVIAGYANQLIAVGKKKTVISIMAGKGNANQKLAQLKGEIDKVNAKKAQAKVSAPGAAAAKGQVDALTQSINAIPTYKKSTIEIEKKETKSRATGGTVGADELTEVNERGAEAARFPDGSLGMLGDGRRMVLPLPGGTEVFTAGETSRMLREGKIPGMATGGKKKKTKKDTRAQNTLAHLDMLNDTGRLSDESEAKMLNKALKSKGKGRLSRDTKYDIARRKFDLSKTRKSEIADLTNQGKQIGASPAAAAQLQKDMAKRHLDEARRNKDARAVAQAENELRQATNDLAAANREMAISSLDAGVALAELTTDTSDDKAAWQAVRDYWTTQLNSLLSDSIDDKTQGQEIAEAARNIKTASDSLGQTAESLNSAAADIAGAAREIARVADDTKTLQGNVLKKAIRDGINEELGGLYGQRLQTSHGRQRSYVPG